MIMKNLLFIFLGVILALSVNAQTPPVAVNDTFYINTDSEITIQRGTIIANDSDVDGNVLIVDTVFYNGTGQIIQTYYTSGAAILRLQNVKYIPQSGYSGLDSLTYILTDNGSPTGFDTAMIYIYVMWSTSANLDINNVSAHIDLEVLFQDRSNAVAGFNVPKQNSVNDPYLNSIYAANLWVAGKDQNGDVRTYSPTFGAGGSDAGPISDNYPFYSERWDRVWKVNQFEIDDFIAWYNNPSNYPGYVIPEAIMSWPGNGYESGQASQLAPFYDMDGDGVYDPTSGDYPLIKGQQAVYFIKNDMRSLHDYSSYPLGIEIHGMAYAYDCPSDSAINHTVFLNYKIYNRSVSNYEDVYTGLWADLDIGNSGDDYIGCDVSRGAFYGYNGDGNDEDGSGIEGYGIHPPAQSVVFLKGPLADNDGIDNPLTVNIQNALDSNGIPYAGLGVGYGDGIVDNEYLGLKHFMYHGTAINNSIGYYNLLQGLYEDGSPLLASDGVTPAKYIFPENSDPLFWGTEGVVVSPWSEISVGNTPGDRRGVGSTGPFTMQAGEMIELDLAFVFGRDYQNTGNTAGIMVMQERIDSIRSYYLNDFQSVCGGTLATGIATNEKQKENELMVYPNPFSNQFMVNYQLANTTAQLKVFNMYGKLVSNQVITKQNTLIDLSNEASGIYFVQITDGATRITKKMVKQ
jgi:hypothetical protein